MIDLEKARLAFEEYLEQFCREDEKIKLKIVHTKGVVRCAAKICDGMRLSREDCDLAQLIALLHDIGRFEQVRRFDSFEPSVMNHAAYGTELLFGSRQMIRRFVKEDTWDAAIRQAIGRHSDYSVGEGLSSRELLHARLIRDADKLDNCRVKLEDSIEVMLGCSAGEAGSQDISPEVWEECKSRKSVHLEKRKTKMDYWVSYIAYFLTSIIHLPPGSFKKSGMWNGSSGGFHTGIRRRKKRCKSWENGRKNICKNLRAVCDRP